MWWLQPPSVGKLSFSNEHCLAPRVLCVWGLYAQLPSVLGKIQAYSSLRGLAALSYSEIVSSLE